MEIIAYAFGIMYTPGPVNLISLNAGLQGQAKKSLSFCAGVGLAMFILFMLCGYASALMVASEWQRPIAILGAIYIAYLAWKIIHSALTQPLTNAHNKIKERPLRFHSGLLMQLLNPKAPLAILPIVTIQFPAADINGMSIAVWSAILALMAFGAPCSYLLIGEKLSFFIEKPRYLKAINIILALLLLTVAADILHANMRN